jgi:hypothetical protein
MREVLSDSKFLVRAFLAFVLVQFLTTFVSPSGATFNKFINNQLSWTAIFFMSCFLFVREDRIDKWIRVVSWLVVFATVIGLWSWWLQRVPWAGHVPSFLAIADEHVQNILYGEHMRSYTNKYRILGTFATPLNLAQFLGLGTSIILYRMVHAKTGVGRAATVFFIPVLLFTIVQTDARLGNVAFFGSMLLYPFLCAIRRWYQDRSGLSGPSVTMAYPGLLLGFLALSLTWRRLEVMIWGGGQQQASSEGRREQWALFWPKIEHWPFGHGPGRAAEVLGWYSGDFLSIDSYYISVALDYGVIGFVLFYGLLAICAVIAAFLFVTRREEVAKFAIIPAVVLVNFIIVKGVLSQADEHSFIFMILGMVVAIKHIIRRETRAEHAEQSRFAR